MMADKQKGQEILKRKVLTKSIKLQAISNTYST